MKIVYVNKSTYHWLTAIAGNKDIFNLRIDNSLKDYIALSEEKSILDLRNTNIQEVQNGTNKNY